MSNIEKKWENKGFRIEYRKSVVALIGKEEYYIPKSVRGEDKTYSWELTELWNSQFPDEKIKFKSELRKR